MSASDTVNPQLIDQKGRLWQERTVVVKREENGFGFTLTQEMPVFVDKVFNGSSAQKAGIHPKDRIIKVNGVSVVGHKHQNVVDMIKDSSHVTLTVISKLRAASNGTTSRNLSSDTQQQSNLEISPPRQLQELTLQSLKTMLHRQRKNYESLSVDYSKQRTDKLEKEIRECEGIIRILELEIAAKSPAIDVHIQTTAASVQSLTPDKPLRPNMATMDESTLRILGIGSDMPGFSSKPSSPSKLNRMGSGDTSPRPSRVQTFNGKVSLLRRTRKTDAEDGSDDDLSDEVDGASDAGPFSSLQDLKGNPAHMSVFLHYLFMSKEPKYLLFYLVAIGYQNHCKTIDLLRQRGMDIYWTFFLDNSPLQLDVEDSIRQRIQVTLENEEVESRLRTVFVEARESLSEIIITDLGNYRHKRVLGLAAMFGDQLVTSQMPVSKQLDVATTILASDLKTCLDEKSATNLQECIKNQAIAACIGTYILEVLSAGTGNKAGSKLPSILEKIQPFTRGDILLKKGKPKKKPFPTLSRSGHSFQLTSYKVATNCDSCGLPLWGVVYHGYQCSICDANVHKFCCMSELNDCAGQTKAAKPRGPRKTSIRKLNKIISMTEEDQLPIPRVSTDSVPLLLNTEDDNLPMDTLPRITGEDEKRSRATSDPKLVVPPQAYSGFHRPSLGGEVERPRVKVERTQSARTQSRSVDSGVTSVEVNTLSWGGGELSSADEAQLANKSGSSELVPPETKQLVDEDFEELLDDNIEEELIPWALMARREVVQNMKRYEVARQENIRELVYTERTHLHKLKIMKYIYKVPLQKQNILSVQQAEQLFPSLEELIQFHSGLCADLKERVGSSQDTPIVKNIADVLLQRFNGAAGERLCHACSIFASNQAKAEKLVKEWKRKNDRFRAFLKTAESHPRSQRLTLHELMPISWTRLTRYKLLIDNILHSYKKNWEELDETDKTEAAQVETVIGCVKGILKHVNKKVKWSTNRQKLADYQSKMDLTAMEKSQHPIAQQFKNLDLTADNRMLIHEGPLTWKIQHRKVVELRAILLTDVLVLLEKHEEKEKYTLRTHTVESVSGTKEELSTVIRLKDCLLRTAAADRGGRTFLLVNNSNLMKLAQMYEFTAENPKEKKKWEDSIERAMLGTQSIMSPEIPSSPIGEDYGRMPLGLPSHLTTREQLDKIDDDMKKLMTDKLDILRSIQVNVGHHSSDSTPKHTMATTSDAPKEIVQAAMEQTSEILATVSHIMVPNPTKSIVSETQTRLTDIIHELQRNLSKLLLHEEYNSGVARLPSLDLTEDSSSDHLGDKDGLPLDSGGVGPDELLPAPCDSTELSQQQDWNSYPEGLFAIGEGKEEEEEEEEEGEGGDLKTEEDKTRLPSAMSSRSNSGNSAGGGLSDYEDDIVAPPDTFAGDTCATPTPGDFLSRHLAGAGLDSGSSTPQCLDSPSLETPQLPKVSPLSTRQLKADDLPLSIRQFKADDPPSLHRAAPNTVSGLAQSSHDSSSPPTITTTSSSSCHEAPPDGVGTPGSVIVTPQDSSTGGGRVLNIWSSSQHNLRPSKDIFTGEILDYSLTPLTGGASSVETETESAADSEDGTDM